ncbi:MAG TPA: SpoIIE family protein phosphatase [Solirubrobacteraceae bacterium]|nr:SpoIIE family protein phosphatase [Solirubrobacteraceae bacterium]
MKADDILAHQPVGSLIVDADTVVRFANPAAAALLGVPSDRIVGQTFGLPLLPGGVTDVNVPGRDGGVRTLAMRVTELPAAPERYLVTLFDVSGRARRYEHEHRLVETLQRSILLDQMPTVDGVQLAARYVPGDGEVRVGGDWYDAIPLPDGRLGLAIGDVTGHGIGSAALMSQLRNALRAYALEHPSPVDVVDHLDRLIHHFEPRGMATMIYLVYELGSGELSFVAAGHPYPLLIDEDGTTLFLKEGRSMPLGTGWRDEREHGTVVLSPGSMLVLYTDGLIERRRRSLDDGFASLAANAHAESQDPDIVCDTILGALLGQEAPDDDVAMLVMHTPIERDAALADPGGRAIRA